MKAVVLAGGKGTRLRPLSLDRPKPLLPVYGKPILDWIIDSLPGYFDEVLLACNYMEDEIARYYGKRDVGVDVKVVEEPRPLGTGGAIKNMESYIEGDFVVFNGDILSSIDVGRVVDFHVEKGGVGTIALWGVEEPSRYGIVGLDEESRITRFKEKPSPSEVFSNLINAGIYVFSREVFDYMERGKKTSVEREVFPRLVDDGLYGIELDGYWIDIGTPSSYLEAHEIIRENTESKMLENQEVGGVVKNSCIYNGVSVEDSCEVFNSVLLEGAVVRDGARVENSVIGSQSEIKGDVRGSVVGDNCVIGDSVEVSGGMRVWNNRMIDKDGFEVV